MNLVRLLACDVFMGAANGSCFLEYKPVPRTVFSGGSAIFPSEQDSARPFACTSGGESTSPLLCPVRSYHQEGAGKDICPKVYFVRDGYRSADRSSMKLSKWGPFAVFRAQIHRRHAPLRQGIAVGELVSFRLAMGNRHHRAA
jgi:hypothetical protein